MDAIGADKDIALRGDSAGTFKRIDKIGRDATFILDKPSEPAAGDDGVRACAFEKGVEEKLLEPATMDGKLWHFVACMHAAKFGPNFLSGFGEIGQAFRSEPHLIKHAEEAKRLKLADCVRQDVDADPGLTDRSGCFIDLDVDIARVQHQSGGQPANSTASDNDLHVTGPQAVAGNLPHALPTARRPRPGWRSARDCGYPRTGRRACGPETPKTGICWSLLNY